MIEWDDKIPEFPIVMAELEKARHWASAKDAPCEIPRFQSFRDNIRPSTQVTPYAAELGDMQEAILSGQGEVMNPQTSIVPKPDFSPEEQIQTYIKGYRYRLFDIVYDDYPALRALIGKKAMDVLIFAYIEAAPSTHFNIARYIEGFPSFAQNHISPCAYELCVLETALSRVFDDAETPVLNPAELAGISADDFAAMKLRPRAALKLLAFSYPINALYQAFLNGEAITEPQKSPSFVAVYRHNDALWRLDLEEGEYLVLSGLGAGLSIGEALNAATAHDAADDAPVAQWFSRWVGNGLLSGIANNSI